MSRPRRPAAPLLPVHLLALSNGLRSHARACPAPCRRCSRRRHRSSGPRAAGSATAVAPERRGSAERCRWRRRWRWSCLTGYPQRNSRTPSVSCRAMRAAALVLALLLPATAAAAGPPSATTGAASSVTQSSATVAGSVDPQGMATTYHFEYGTSVELRPADGRRRRGLGHRSRRRVGRPHRADQRHHLPLPRRRDQRGRRHARVGSHAEDRRPSRPARRDDGLGAQRHRVGRAARRLGRPQRAPHDLPLRVGHDQPATASAPARRARAAGRARAASARPSRA